MAILNFVKPDKIVLQKATEFEAIFEFRPLEPGYGHHRQLSSQGVA
ncbi:MAG: hypothetical protein R2765_04505 [Ferruginibacter sp.]